MCKITLPKIVFHFNKRTCQLLTIALLMTGFQSNAQTIYVDKQLSAGCTGNYSISNRDCSGSDGDAYKTLQSAAAAAVAGTQVLIREGEYSNEQLSPQHSGTENNYITFKNFEDEVVEITGESLSPAVWIDRKDYIVIEGLKVHDVDRWLNALGSNHIIIRNNEFERALNPYGSSKTGIFMQSCTHVKILNNIINESTQDNIGMIASDYNLIEGNVITRAKHVLWTLKCSNYNVIRGNYFHNELQKIGEIYDCHNAGYGSNRFPKLYSYDDTKFNVVEMNIFAYTPSPVDKSPYAGIQYAAQNGIIRNNVFYECEGPPISLTYYSDEAKYCYSNRISHNVFFNNEFGGIRITGTESDNFKDQQIKNNIFFKNKFIQRDFRWSWYDELNNKPVQIYTSRDSDILFERNNIFNSEADELYVITYGSRFSSSSNPAPEPLSWWEINHSQVFKSNKQFDPGFVDEINKDFHLQGNSLMIDAGAFLTKTTNSGANSTVMEVDDPGWFMDGFGIVSADTIQIEGQTSYAIIQSINYTTRTLTLDRALSWDTGRGVSLKYCNARPDIGAFEYRLRPSGADDLFYENEAAIIPNPTDGTFQIELGRNDSVEKVLIYNSSGQQVKVAYSNEVNISDLEAGLYYVKIASGNGKTMTGKIVNL